MSVILLTTTGTGLDAQNSIFISDLGRRFYYDPSGTYITPIGPSILTANVNISLEFHDEVIRRSSDLQAAIDAGHITLRNGITNETITDVSGIGLSGANLLDSIADELILLPCIVATLGNINLVSGWTDGMTYDGVVININDPILVWQQTNPIENGIYYLVGDGTLARHANYITGDIIKGSSMVPVQQGTTYAESLFICTNNTDVIIDTDSLNFITAPKNILDHFVDQDNPHKNPFSVTHGTGNIAFDSDIDNNVLGGTLNTNFGYQSLKNTTNNENAAFGYQALMSNVTGDENAAFGCLALKNNTGFQNSAFGHSAGRDNIGGDNLCLVGFAAGRSNQTGISNTAFGSYSLFSNVSGNYNSAFGLQSLNTVTGSYNTGIGSRAGYDLINTSNNTMVGYDSGRGITTGSGNTIIGANVTGLASNLSNSIVIADGQGTQRIFADSNGYMQIFATIRSYKRTVRSYDANTNIVVDDSGAMIYNNGASPITFTLPAAAIGLEYTFMRLNIGTILIKPAVGEYIWCSGISQSVSDGIRLTLQRDSVILVARSNGWMVIAMAGQPSTEV